MGFTHNSVSWESACNVGDPSLILRSGRSPGEGNGNPLQDSCLENPMDKGTWQATVHGFTRVRHNLVAKPTIVPCVCVCVCVCVHAHLVQLCSTLCDLIGYSPRLLCPWGFPGKNTGVGCHAHLQGILLTQGLNPSLLQPLHCRWILYWWATGEAHSSLAI